MFVVSRALVLALAVSSLIGCASSGARYQPIIDGPANEEYQADLASCGSLAEQLKFDNGDVRSEAVAGALLGGLMGALEDGTAGAIAGSAAGALVGGTDRAWDVREERKQIVIRCLSNRGHNVVG